MDQLPGYQTLAALSEQQLTEIFGVRDFFVYEVDFSGLAADVTATQTFNIQSDSNFLWQYGCFSADVDGEAQDAAGRVIPLVSGVIIDSASGRQLMNANVPIQAFFGDGSLPFLLPTPRFFRASTTVSISLLNYSDDQTYNLKLSLIGTKFFKYAQQI